MKTLSRSASASGAIDARHAALGPRPVRISSDWRRRVSSRLCRLDGRCRQRQGRVRRRRRHSSGAAPARAAGAAGAGQPLHGAVARQSAGRDVEDRRVVGAIECTLDPHSRWRETLRVAEAADLRFVVSNTTEAGIVGVAESYDPAVCPESFPAKAAALLKARYDALGGAEAPGLVFLPCELIERTARLSGESFSPMSRDGVSGRHSRPGSKSATSSLTRSSTGSCPDFPQSKRTRSSRDGATAIPWRLRRSHFISG